MVGCTEETKGCNSPPLSISRMNISRITMIHKLLSLLLVTKLSSSTTNLSMNSPTDSLLKLLIYKMVMSLLLINLLLKTTLKEKLNHVRRASRPRTFSLETRCALIKRRCIQQLSPHLHFHHSNPTIDRQTFYWVFQVLGLKVKFKKLCLKVCTKVQAHPSWCPTSTEAHRLKQQSKLSIQN